MLFRSDTEYRLWVFAGACCAETFAFALQATDLAGAEPGGPAAHPVPVQVGNLRKDHASHGGKKEPSRWDWIPVPIPPKFAATGPKKVRLVGDQQGFSVAWALASPLRKAAPRESEAKEWEKGRPALAVAGASAVAGTGSILREWWTGIPGDTVANLLSSLTYPNRPSGREFLTVFEGPTNWADDYGTRIRGYVHPPASGDYVFWISGDDQSELYVSPDDSPARKDRVAWVSVSKLGEWERVGTQKSKPIHLEAGKRYYVEVLHKEGKVDDHIAVGWTCPDGTLERPISGEWLSPFDPK